MFGFRPSSSSNEPMQQSTQDRSSDTPLGQPISNQLTVKTSEKKSHIESHCSERDFKKLDESVSGYKLKIKECKKNMANMMYRTLPRQFQHKHVRDELPAAPLTNREEKYCFVCKKIIESTKSHLKIIHNIPKDCGDLKKLYGIFTHGKECLQELVVEKGKPFVMNLKANKKGGLTDKPNKLDSSSILQQFPKLNTQEETTDEEHDDEILEFQE